MASRSDIEAGAAYVRLYVKNSDLLKGLDQFKKELRKLGVDIAAIGTWMMKLGGLIVAPLLLAIRHFEQTGSALKDMSIRTGVSAASLAELGYAAGQSGGALEDVETSIRKMQKAIDAAGGATGKVSKALNEITEAGGKENVFQKLGLSVEKLKAMAPEEQFMAIAEAISKVPAGDQQARALEVWGKTGTKMLPMLENGIDGLKRMREEFRALGGPTDDEVNKADELGDAFGKLRMIGSNAAFSIGAALAPAAKEFIDTASGAAKGVQEWARKNTQLVQTIAKAGAGLLIAGAATFTFGKLIGVASYAVGALRVLLTPATAALGLLRFAMLRVQSAATGVIKSIQAMASSIGTSSQAASGHVGKILLGVGRVAYGFGQIGFAAGQSLVTSIASSARAAAPRVLQAVRAMGSGLLSVASFHAGQMASAFAPLGNLISARLAPIAAAIGKRLRGPFLEAYLAASIVANRIAPIWNRVSAVASTVASRVVAVWRVAAPAIARALTNTITGAFNRIRAAGNATAGFLSRGAGNVGRGIGGIASGVSGLLGMFGAGAGGALGSIGAAVPMVLMLATSFTALLNPVTLVLAAVAGGAYAWFTFSESGQKALKSIMAVLQPFIDIAKQTVRGITDAFKGGDLELAGKIALAGLKLAFVTATNEIGKAIGGVFGNTFGKIGAQILGGDFMGAWNTALKGMYASLVEFTEGLVAMFTIGAKAAAEVWKSTVDQISGFLLEASAAGGAAGVVASGILGVDMQGEAARGALLKRKNKAEAIKTLESQIAQWEAELPMKEAAGQLDGEDGANRIRADIERDKKKLADMKSGVGGSQADVVAEAKRIAREATAGIVNGFNEGLDQLNRDAQQATQDAKADLAADVAGGMNAGEEAARKAREELNALTLEAAGKRAKAEAEAVKKEDINNPDIAAMRNATAVTFSASALVALGSNGGPQERIAKGIDKMLEKLGIVITNTRHNVEATIKLEDAMRIV